MKGLRNRTNSLIGLIVFALLTLLMAISITPSALQSSWAASPQAQPTCTPPPSGLLAWWPGDGNAFDILDSHDGAPQNGASFSAGKVDQAFGFDGSNAVIEVPNSSAWNFGTTSFTIDTWVKFNALSGLDVLAAHDEGSGGLNKWIFWHRSGQLELHLFGPSTPLTYIGVPFSPTLGQWYHVAITRSGNIYRFYVDGSQIGGDQTNTISIPYADAPLTMGKAEAIPSLNGLLDEVEIFNRALSQAEIDAIHDADSVGKCRTCTPAPSNMISWWQAENNTNDNQDSNQGTFLANTYSPGKVGQAFSFNGSSEVAVANNASLNVQNFTIDAWVFPTTLDGGNEIIVTKETDSAFQYLMSIRGPGRPGPSIPLGNLAFYIGGLSGLPNDQEGWVDGGGAVPLNTWTHVALTFDGSSAKTYINGEVKRDIGGLSGSVTVSNGAFRIGSRDPGLSGADPGAPFNGSIDEVEIFNRALSQTEIKNIVGAGSAGKCDDGDDISRESDNCPLDFNPDQTDTDHDGVGDVCDPDDDNDADPDAADCAPLNPTVNHHALEVCNGIDDDCDGMVDEGCPTQSPADLDVEKSDASDPVLLGSRVSYKIEVENKGPGNATNVRIVDMLPSGLSEISAPGCTISGYTVTCSIPSLAKCQEVTRTITAKTTATGTITNTVTVTANEPDPDSSNNTDRENTKVVLGVASVSLSPNSIKGGNNVPGTVKLSAPVPNHGSAVTVTLASSNSSVAKPTVSSITISSGDTRTFTVKTFKVSSTKQVKIKATANSISKEATLTVKP